MKSCEYDPRDPSSLMSSEYLRSDGALVPLFNEILGSKIEVSTTPSKVVQTRLFNWTVTKWKSVQRKLFESNCQPKIIIHRQRGRERERPPTHPLMLKCRSSGRGLRLPPSLQPLRAVLPVRGGRFRFSAKVRAPADKKIPSLHLFSARRIERRRLSFPVSSRSWNGCQPTAGARNDD